MKAKNDCLFLPLKGKWYDMIESGIKKEEYREVKPYWCRRISSDASCPYHYVGSSINSTTHYVSMCSLFNRRGCYHSEINVYARKYKTVRFSYGYTNRAMTFELIGIEIRKGKVEWGALPDKDYFVLKLGNRVA